VLLVIDIGNSNTVLGVYDGETLVHHFRISTQRRATADEYEVQLVLLLQRRGIETSQITGAILSSVVPQLNRAFSEMCVQAFGMRPVVVGPGIRTGMPIKTENPSEVGADRIVNAVAAWNRFAGSLVVVDFGTATTFDAVNERGEYLGGAIAPGVEVSIDALFTRAAKLPRIEIKNPKRIIGKNTVAAMQSGLFFGYAGLVDALAGRMRDELGPGTRVIATGGLARLFKDHSEVIEEVDDFLTLEGLKLLFEMNRPESTS